MLIYRLLVLIFIVAFVFPFTIRAEIPLTETSKKSVDGLYMKAWELRIDTPDSAIHYANLQQEMAEKINYKLGIINAHYVKGIVYNSTNNFNLAANEFYIALSLINKSNEYEFLRKKSLILQGLGQSYDRTFNYDMAIEINKEGLQIAHSINYESSIADLSYNLGVCYKEKNEFELALEYSLEALSLYERRDSYDDVLDVYNIMGMLYKNRREYDLAKKHYKKAILIADEHNTSTRKKSWFISNIGETYFVQNQYDSAKFYYLAALELSEQIEDVERVKIISNNVGDVYLKQKNYAEAIAYYQKSIALGNGDDRIDEEMKRAYKQLAVAYEATEQYKDALAYTHRFMDQVALLEETKDKLMVQNAQYRMKEVEWQRQLADKETLLAQLKSWLNNGLAVFALFLIVFGYISWRLYLHYTVHKEMKRILMTPISVELERLERKEKGQDNDDED